MSILMDLVKSQNPYSRGGNSQLVAELIPPLESHSSRSRPVDELFSIHHYSQSIQSASLGKRTVNSVPFPE